jgi:hypothetical protein
MQETGVISDYVELLASELSFDRSLSRCVRQEVEDHLWEAVAANPTDNPLEAERHAIANFGDPHVLAAQFAVVSLAKQTRRVGVAVILVVAAVFIAMKARVAWYAATQWAMSDDLRAVGAIVGVIDSCAFWLSVLVGIGGWIYIGSRPIPAAFYPAYRKQLRCCFLLCAAATGALIVSVISDGVLTALRLLGTGLSAEFLVPILSMAIEIVCAGVLVFHIRRMIQRTASAAAALLKM